MDNPNCSYIQGKSTHRAGGLPPYVAADGTGSERPERPFAQLHNQKTSAPRIGLTFRSEETSAPRIGLAFRNEETSAPRSGLAFRNEETSAPRIGLTFRNEETSAPRSGDHFQPKPPLNN
jgi:hypothetical protein